MLLLLARDFFFGSFFLFSFVLSIRRSSRHISHFICLCKAPSLSSRVWLCFLTTKSSRRWQQEKLMKHLPMFEWNPKNFFFCEPQHIRPDREWKKEKSENGWQEFLLSVSMFPLMCAPVCCCDENEALSNELDRQNNDSASSFRVCMRKHKQIAPLIKPTFKSEIKQKI